MALVVCCLLAAGCGGRSSKPPSESDQSGAKPTETPQAAPDGSQVSVALIDGPAYEAFLRQQRGKVVLVDFWATWCSPCVELLPHTAAVARRLADRGLVVATISLDEPEQESQVRKVLATHGLTAARHFIARPGAPDQAQSDPFKVFAIPGGSVPHFKLYGPDGRLHRTFDSDSKTIDAKQIDQAVEELLGK